MVKSILRKLASLIENSLENSSLLSHITVLIIDDDESITTIMKKSLKHLGCPNVIALNTAEEGIAYLKNNKVNIVLMDIKLGNADFGGITAVNEIKKFKNLPVVYISGQIDDEILEKIKQTKPYGFLQKPFNTNELKITIELAMFNFIKDSKDYNKQRLHYVLNENGMATYSVYFENDLPVLTTYGPGYEKLTGYTAEDHYANSDLWFEMIPLEERSRVRSHFINVNQGLTTEPIEHNLFTKNGQKIWVKTTVIHHFNEQGHIDYYDGLICNITDSKNKELSILEYQSHLEDMVAERTENLKKANKELSDFRDKQFIELKQARKTMQALLPPDSTYENNQLKICYHYEPVEEIGGDFISITHFNELNTYGVFLGDICGHGTPAALYISGLKTLTDRICRNYGLRPKEYLENLHTDLLKMLNDNCGSYFVASLYGFFQPEEENTVFSFANAGQPNPLIYRKQTGQIQSINTVGRYLGVENFSIIKEQQLVLNKGDRLFLYTDGINEMYNEQNNYLEIEGFKNILFTANNLELDLNEAFQEILNSLNIFRGRAPINDDIILFSAEIK